MSYHIAAKRRPKWRGISKFAAKSIKLSARKQRRNDAKPFIISTDAYPWAF